MPHPFPNSVTLVEVPYQGHGFMVAANNHDFSIKEIKLDGKWWPIQEVASPALRGALQRTLLEMPSNVREQA